MLGLQTTWTRRGWMTRTAAGMAGASWLSRMAAAGETASRPPRSCLLLWMNGGPSQTDTFDLKPGHEHGGPFSPIETSVPGIVISEHLPRTAQWMHRLSVIRSMSTREGDHGRARDHLRTGYLPQGPIQFPVLGSLVSHEHADRSSDLPNYVSILPRGLFRAGMPPAGFLGPHHAPLMIGGSSEDGETMLRVDNLAAPSSVSVGQSLARLDLLRQMERSFLDQHPGPAADGHRSAYERSTRLMSPSATEAFDLSGESAQCKERYGTSQFGQGCLLARRMLERGVPFVEVTLGGWDTHYDNFNAVERLSATLDQAWSALLQELDERGLLETTLVVWMGEFGRTPVINPQVGRDHYPKAWSAVLGGGGIRGGQIVGRTSDDGLSVEDRPVATEDLLATICRAMGLDPMKQNISNVARPIRLVDPSAQPITEILT
ncbi:MAG: DUF1501 domain-containing protein [Planctomycetaceae bacterium]|nr:DUF1501 domain-containing protein [Planctomycetaceae bacterium]